MLRFLHLRKRPYRFVKDEYYYRQSTRPIKDECPFVGTKTSVESPTGRYDYVKVDYLELEEKEEDIFAQSMGCLAGSLGLAYFGGMDPNFIIAPFVGFNVVRFRNLHSDGRLETYRANIREFEGLSDIIEDMKKSETR